MGGASKLACDLNRRVEFRGTWDPHDETDPSVDNPLSGGADVVIEPQGIEAQDPPQ